MEPALKWPPHGHAQRWGVACDTESVRVGSSQWTPQNLTTGRGRERLLFEGEITRVSEAVTPKFTRVAGHE